MSSQNLLVSILIPVFNAEKYIERGLLSVINQTYKNLEVIIVDDHSMDASLQCIENFRSSHPQIKIIVIKHKTNLGVSAARNSLLDHANGDLFAFLDADDYFANTLIEKLIYLIKEKDVDVAQCAFFKENDNGQYKSIYPIRTSRMALTGHQVILEMLEGKIPGFLWNKIFKRHVFDDVRFDIKKKAFEDYEVLLKIFLNNASLFSTCEPLYYYIQRPQSLTKKSYLEATTRLEYLDLTKELVSPALQNKSDKQLLLVHEYSVIIDVARFIAKNYANESSSYDGINTCKKRLSLIGLLKIMSRLSIKTFVAAFILISSPRVFIYILNYRKRNVPIS
ncbi:glycosyltransferase family 2 protein [Sodalis sp. RH19]|uniref:glycosyltransferase family 2 protein n=1 Tax=Sodalis sp. RH19 TaxID=3394334 RepID=UPI0039B4F6AA